MDTKQINNSPRKYIEKPQQEKNPVPASINARISRQGEGILERLQRDKRILDMLCHDFTAVYYIDLNTGSFTTLKLGENTNADLLQRENDVILENFDLYARQYADKYIREKDKGKFLAWFNCRNLKQKLLGKDRITYHYRSLPNKSGKKFFDTQVIKVHVDSRIFKVFMSFRHIDDILEPEITTQEKLQKALDVLRLNNEIISTIGKSYDAIFRIDLRADYFEEISTIDGIHKLTGREGCASHRLHVLCTNMVSKPFQSVVEKFCDLRSLPKKLAHEETVVTEYQLKSGSWQKLRFIVKKRDDGGNVTHVLCCLRNISDIKRREVDLRYKEAVAKREVAEKNRFLSNMSHDIRTPLNGIIGMLELANRYPDNQEIQQKSREQSMKSLKYLVSLVNDILDMNKLENDAAAPQELNFDVAELLNRINQDAADQAKAKNIHYAVEWDKGAIQHRFLTGNPVYVGRILSNIADNAIKFSQPGSTVHVWGREEACQGNTVVYAFYCQDHGTGISEDFLPQVFEMFTQEQKSTNIKYIGSGLGLAIAKKLADRLHGSIELYSKKGKGTTAVVKLPFKIGSEEQLRHFGDYQHLSLKGKRVLVVDDNELNRDIARFLLEDNGIVVEEACNGQEAVKKFASSKAGYYDIILMDIMMPKLNGWEAASQIRNMKRWDAERLPIIALSANSFADDIVSSRLAGMDIHLSKPLNEEKMLEAMKKCLSNAMQNKKL